MLAALKVIMADTGKCHSKNRRKDICWRYLTEGKYSDFTTYDQLHEEYRVYPAIDKAEECTKEIVFPE